MGKFTTIATYLRFESMWNNNNINNYSLYFILDTGQLYAHGILLNSVVYGTEASGAVPITIAGVTKSLALASHTHSNYILNNQNIDLQSYKLVSGNNDLIYLSNSNIYTGNTSVPITILSSTDLKSYRDTHLYTILDTGNFSIGNTTSTNYTLNNVAVFKYGSSSFLLDYVKRVNTSSTFDSLNTYTLAGTTLVNNKQYGIITLYTDGTTLNPSWALLRINIPDRTVEYRTSSLSNNWIGLSSPELVQNALDLAGIVAAPSSQTINMVWKTDALGNPAWREEASSSDTWRNIRINDDTSDKLGTTTSSGALYIKSGNGISVSWDDGKLLITNSSPNVWLEATYNLEGYVPQATKGKFLHCNSSSGELEWTDDNNTWNAVNTSLAGYVPQVVTTGSLASNDNPFILVYKNVSGVTTPAWVPLPANAFNDTWTAFTAATASNAGTAGYIQAPAGALDKFFRGDNTWQDVLLLSGGTMTGILTVPKIRINKTHSASSKAGGIYYYDETTDYLLIGYGASNLWIGANSTSGTHHTGSTYISAGDGDVYVSKLTNNTRTNYLVYHAGNIPSNTKNTAGIVAKGVASRVYMTDDTGAPSWTLYDTTVTSDSGKLVTSGAVYTAIANNVAGAVQYLGTVTSESAMTAFTLAGKGDFVRVITSFSFTDASGSSVTAHVGDAIYLTNDTPGTSSNWIVAHTEIDTDTWTAASTSAAGYIPKLTTGGTALADSTNDYILAFVDGTNTSPVWKKLPSTAYTDLYVLQTKTTTANYRGILLSYNNNATANTGIESDATNAVYTTNKIVAQPSTGNIMSQGSGTFAGLICSSGNLTFNSDSHILWNDGSYHQRLFITDDNTADTAVFTFLQSTNSGSSWTDLLTIKDNGKVVATTFVGALSGNATTASDLSKTNEKGFLYQSADTSTSVTGYGTRDTTKIGIPYIHHTSSSNDTYVLGEDLFYKSGETKYIGNDIHSTKFACIKTKNATTDDWTGSSTSGSGSGETVTYTAGSGISINGGVISTTRNEWYGTEALFNSLSSLDANTTYYIIAN